MNAPAITRRTLIILLVVALTALIARVVPAPRTIDDAFITFRYARNLVEGQGFVYNPGVQTLGTTTPLYTLLMAAISGVTGGQDFPWYALTVNALADAGAALLLFLIARRVTGSDWIGGLLGLLWAVSPRSVAFAVGGMETSVVILWMLAAVWAYLQAENGNSGGGRDESRPYSAVFVGIFCALGFLTRIDTVLWSGPLLLYQLGESLLARRDQPLLKRLPWATWLAGLAVVLPWLIFSWVYFGSPVPNSISAKTVAYLVAPLSAMIALIQHYANPFFEVFTFGGVATAAGAIGYLLLNGVAMLSARRRAPRLLPFLIYPWLYLLVFSVANPLIFRWYLNPPMPALMLGIVIGLWTILNGLRERFPQVAAARLAMPVVFAVFGGVWLFTSLHEWEVRPAHGPERPAPLMAWHQIELMYQDVATDLVENHGVTPQTIVASGDIGAIGYFTRAVIVDTVGLVTPAMRAYYPVNPAIIPSDANYAIPPQMIADTNPQYLVAMESMVRLGLEQDADFTTRYDLLRAIPTDFYGTSMNVYGRR
jgi:hypothetical protein